VRDGLRRHGRRVGKAVRRMTNELLQLVPAALELVKLLTAGDVAKAERKAKALAQAIALKKAARELVKVARR
jgi:hypothetical protein